MDNKQETYIVDNIVEKRTRGGVVEYLVKWNGYDSSQNTWEPAENLSNVPEIIEKFEEEEKAKNVADVESNDVSENRKLKPEESKEKTYFVEKIVKKRTRGNVVEYQVKWKGYRSSQNTWEPVEHLASCPEVVEAFEERERAKLAATGFNRNLVPERIENAVEVDGDYCFLIKWRGCEEPDIVPAAEAHKYCPQLVIRFYEERIRWR